MASSDSTEGLTLTFMTWNVGKGTKPGKRAELARLLRDEKVDVAFLQEVDLCFLKETSDKKEKGEDQNLFNKVMKMYDQYWGCSKETLFPSKKGKGEKEKAVDVRDALLTLIKKDLGTKTEDIEGMNLDECPDPFSGKVGSSISQNFQRLLRVGPFVNIHNGSAAVVHFEHFEEYVKIDRETPFPQLILAGDFNVKISPGDRGVKSVPQLKGLLDRQKLADVVQDNSNKKKYSTRGDNRNDRIYIRDPSQVGENKLRMHVIRVHTLKLNSDGSAVSDHQAVVCTVKIDKNEPTKCSNKICSIHHDQERCRRCELNTLCEIWRAACKECGYEVHVTKPDRCTDRNFLSGKGLCVTCDKQVDGQHIIESIEEVRTSVEVQIKELKDSLEEKLNRIIEKLHITEDISGGEINSDHSHPTHSSGQGSSGGHSSHPTVIQQ